MSQDYLLHLPAKPVRLFYIRACGRMIIQYDGAFVEIRKKTRLQLFGSHPCAETKRSDEGKGDHRFGEQPGEPMQLAGGIANMIFWMFWLQNCLVTDDQVQHRQ